MAHDPESSRLTDSGFARNGLNGDHADPVAAMAERLQRLEDQLDALRARQAAEPSGLAALVPTVTGMFLPAAGRFANLPSAGRVWDRLGFLTEFRLMVRMYVDARYRLSRVAQFGVPAVLIAMAANYLFWQQIIFTVMLVTPVLERLSLVLLAVVLYKILAREAGRYAAVLAYLARHERAPA